MKCVLFVDIHYVLFKLTPLDKFLIHAIIIDKLEDTVNQDRMLGRAERLDKRDNIKEAIYEYIKFCMVRGYLQKVDVLNLYTFLQNYPDSGITFILEGTDKEVRSIKEGRFFVVDMRETVEKLRKHKDEFDWSKIENYL